MTPPRTRFAKELGALVVACLINALFMAQNLHARRDKNGATTVGPDRSAIEARIARRPDQVEDVRAYLDTVAAERAPGVTPDSVDVGAFLPRGGGRVSELSEDARAVLEAALADVNAQGGVFGRRIHLRSRNTGDAGEGPVFAWLGGLPREADASRDADAVPEIAPYGLADDGEATTAAPRFFVYPGVALQARWALQRLAEEGLRAPVAVIASPDAQGDAWARAIASEVDRGSVRVGLVQLRLTGGASQPAELRAWLDEKKPGTILFSGAPEALAEAAEWAGRTTGGRRARAVVVASAESGRAPGREGTQVFADVRFVSPASPEEGGAHEHALLEFLERHELTPRHLTAQANALAAARIFVEALRRAGPEPTRAALVRALESLQDFDTGVAPPLTFGPGARVGVLGACWTRIDHRTGGLTSAASWAALSL